MHNGIAHDLRVLGLVLDGRPVHGIDVIARSHKGIKRLDRRIAALRILADGRPTDKAIVQHVNGDLVHDMKRLLGCPNDHAGAAGAPPQSSKVLCETTVIWAALRLSSQIQTAFPCEVLPKFAKRQFLMVAPGACTAMAPFSPSLEMPSIVTPRAAIAKPLLICALPACRSADRDRGAGEVREGVPTVL